MISLNGSTDVNGSFVEPESCNLTLNPWCGVFGGRQVFEVIYLLFVSVFGSIGNLLVISSIIYKRRLHKHGNIFIVNLAVADLIVSVYRKNIVESWSNFDSFLQLLGNFIDLEALVILKN